MKGAAAIDESGRVASTSKVPCCCRRLRNVVKRRHSSCATGARSVAEGRVLEESLCIPHSRSAEVASVLSRG
eukprot:scaffold42798_cov66-Phaeocystis_antarctica.AAC.4